MNVAPEDCVVFEDGDYGIEAAKSAGMKWIDIREYMRSRLKQKIYLADLAHQVGMSKFAFVRKYKRLSGRTPMQDLQRMRLNQARNMLLASGLPLKAIAPEVGLGDEYQLSKLFRRHFRLSPSELRMRSRRTS